MNEKVKAYVTVAKGLIRKVKENKEDLSIVLLEWRTTYIKDMGASPVQLLY